MFTRFFHWLWSRFRYEIKNFNGQVQLIRYRLLKTPFGSLYIHHFLRSDADRHLHDHPWNFKSIVLWGGYWEEYPVWMNYQGGRKNFIRETGFKWIGPLRMNRKQADDPHRVFLEKGSTTWTLIYVGPKIKEWGFYTDDGWIHWESYKPKNL